MKIVIDARLYGTKRGTGIGRYLQRLIAELEQLDNENEYLVLLEKGNFDEYQPRVPNFSKIPAPYPIYSFGEQLGLARLLWRLKADLVHFPAPNTPLLYRKRRVITMHDLTLVEFNTSRGAGFARWLRGLKRLPFRLVAWNDAKFANNIFALTEYTKERIARRYHVTRNKIAVTPLASEPNLAEPEPIERLGVGKDFLLYVGNFYPYKNVGSTIEAMKFLAAKRPELKLVVVGKQDYFRTVLEERVRELGLGDRVVFTGFVSDGELVSLYRAAKLYVYPSLSEGFGLQGLEAMTQGCPVLAARASCLPEVYGDAAVYFDPNDAKDQAEKISDLLANEALREKLRKAGSRRVKQFSWRRMAEQTLEVYNAVVRERG